MQEEEMVALLDLAVSDLEVGPIDAGSLARPARRRRAVRRGTTVALGCAVVVAIAIGGLVLRPSGTADQATDPTTSGGAGCVDDVPPALLPTWARTGFSDPLPRIPYVLGDGGDIVAILFGQPLTSPSERNRNNKILWVGNPNAASDGSSGGSADLQIEAQLEGTSTTVTREVSGGPGPSTIDLPEPGCWLMTLHWGDHQDALSLRYAEPATLSPGPAPQ